MIEVYHQNITPQVEKDLRLFQQKNPTVSFAFQDVEMYHFFRGLKGFEPYCFIERENNGEVLAYLMACIVTSYPLGRFGKRCVIWGDAKIGDIAVQQHAIDALLKSVKEHLASKVIYIEQRNFNATYNQQDVYKVNGFVFKDRYGMKVPTVGSKEAWELLSESKRRQIKKTEDAGVHVEKLEQINDLKAFYVLLEKLYLKLKKPLPAFDFLEGFVKSDLGVVLGLKKGHEVIGGVVLVCEPNKGVFEWYIAGKDKVYKDIYPSVFATWAGIRYAIENGHAYFDFMGGGKPGEKYGVREFKKKFGAKPENYGRWYYSKYQGLLTFAERIGFINI